MNSDSAYSAQQIEATMLLNAKHRFDKNLEKANKNNRSTTVPGGAYSLLGRSVLPMSIALTQWKKEIADGGVGRRPVAYHVLSTLKNDRLTSFIASKMILNCLVQSHKAVFVAVMIAHALEDEVRLNDYASTVDKYHAEWIGKNYQAPISAKKKRVFLHAKLDYEKHIWHRWSITQKLQLGMQLIEIFIGSTGLVTTWIDREGSNPRKQKTTIRLQATPEALKIIEERDNRGPLLQPIYLPLTTPPKPWVSVLSGGYENLTLPSVKSTQVHYLEEIDNHKSEMSEPYKAMNVVQETPWRINTKIFEIIEILKLGNKEIPGITVSESIPVKPYPKNAPSGSAASKAWRKEAAIVFQENRRLISKRLALALKLSLAQQYTGKDIFYPVQLDFRGRMYSIPGNLNPQGDDLSKALLEFSVGKPLGSDGIKWLHRYIGTCWGHGVDKASFEDREQWTLEHRSMLFSIARDPIEDLRWTDADEPWRFLAAVLDYRGMLDTEAWCTYISHLPIHIDGSCSGLQHFSALLRDTKGATAVNLVPNEKPQDLYSQVSTRLLEIVEEKCKLGDSTALLWRDSGLIDRKLVKRNVMTLSYGVTQQGVRAQIQLELKERKDNLPGKRLPFGPDDLHGYAAVRWIAPLVWQAIGDTVTAAHAAMEWLQKVSVLASSTHLPMYWSAPSGFLVCQNYRDTKKYRVRSRLHGKVFLATMRKETGKVDARKMKVSIAANFVHSLDASHLVLAVNRAYDLGITSISVVHDSFAAHASEMEILGKALRETMVEMYQTPVLENWYKTVKDGLVGKIPLDWLPELPPRGDLNLELINDSPYVFA